MDGEGQVRGGGGGVRRANRVGERRVRRFFSVHELNSRGQTFEFPKGAKHVREQFRFPESEVPLSSATGINWNKAFRISGFCNRFNCAGVNHSFESCVKTKLALYKALILPHFTYCCTVWMHCGKTVAAKLEKRNERAMRAIFNDNIMLYLKLQTCLLRIIEESRICVYLYI